MKTKLAVILLLSVAALLSSCKGPSTKIILSLWDTNTQDRVYSQRSKQVKQAFKSHNINIRYEQLYLDAGYRDAQEMGSALALCLDSLERLGKTPDLIISYGNTCNDIILQSKDRRLEEIPAISFGVTIQNDSLAALKNNVTLIKDTICLKENLRLMEDILKSNFRAVTPLDWTFSWQDNDLRSQVSQQMDNLDSSRFFNGMMLDCSEKDLLEAQKDGKSILYALSLYDISANRSQFSGEDMRTSWAFSPSSGNSILMLKHDVVTTRLESNPHTQPYFTGVAGAFGVWDKCIGGYFSPFENLLDEVIQKAERIFRGESPSLIPTTTSHCDYYVNWDALREDYLFGELPSYINVLNAKVSDKNPDLYNSLYAILKGLGAILAIGGLIFFIWYLFKGYSKNKEIQERSLLAMEEMNNLQYMIKHSTAVLWSLEGRTIMYDGAMFSKGVVLSDRIAQSNEYFRGKLNEFFANNLPGVYNIQIPRTDSDGVDRWYEIRMFIEDGRYGLKKSGITINIDDQKQMEREILEAYRLSAIANEREKFISTMSHEMRTPLNSIVGFSQILSNPDYICSDDDLQIFGKAIEENNSELMKIIEDMLAITHMDNANIKMSITEIYLKDIFGSKMTEYLDQSCAKKNISYVIEKGPSDACIRADSNLLKIILNNIISNAIKFSPEGSAITLGWREGFRNMIIYVSDNGIGISKPDQENIFKRFYQVDNFTQGTGLGLALAKEYTEKMNGSITVDSTLAKGSTFYVRFEKIKKEVSHA